ncbi:MAG: acyl-CoA reductase [Flavobacteriaceae bacterium]|nr:acyl-CoA reductase [Flavobacteriaceae bacterium]
MQNTQRIEAFLALGNNLESFIRHFNDENRGEKQTEFNQKLELAKAQNAWFDIDNQLFALNSWAQALQKENLIKWLSAYHFPESQNPKTVGIITAGNIPLVGFHDIVTVILSGNIAQIKLSSHDAVLIPYLLQMLTEIEPKMVYQFQCVEKLQNYDMVIATGSDNTARYFEAYFKHVPHVIRKNRTSAAVLTGDETSEDLQGLAQDILQHYGLGCRNITKLFLPANYNLDLIFNALYSWKELINHHKYANNYDYHKAIYLMENAKLTENGFVLFKEDERLFSPVSTVFYEFYSSMNEVEEKLDNLSEKIQCIVGLGEKFIDFGEAQRPKLWEYADHVDTMKFLISASK